MKNGNEELEVAIKAAVKGGKAIMEVYASDDFHIESKSDDSPLTIADKKANDEINEMLVPTGIPIISEENKQIDFSERKNWKRCWIVDPLDGTKEFIKRNGEFTVNIALIEEGKPVLGVIYVPAVNILYFGDVNDGKSYMIKLEGHNVSEGQLASAVEIGPKKLGDKLKVVGSRSHMNEDTLDYINSLKEEYKKEVEVVSKGSSLKFCLVAEGLADVYPRFAPTMEWDTAAGQAICKAVGLKVIDKETEKEMVYNREKLLNNYFLVSNLE